MIGPPPRTSGRGLLAFRIVLPGCLAAPILALVLLSAVAGCMQRAGFGDGEPDTPDGLLVHATTVTVERVVDGDTIRTEEILGTLPDGRPNHAVRLIGVDTPETKHPLRGVECYGPEAAAATRQAMPPGITVRLLYEQAPGGGVDNRPRARTDQFGRTLAYVYLTDGTHWNEALVSRGLGRAAYYSPNDDHKATFEAAQADASQAGRGGWSACDWRPLP